MEDTETLQEIVCVKHDKDNNFNLKLIFLQLKCSR